MKSNLSTGKQLRSSICNVVILQYCLIITSLLPLNDCILLNFISSMWYFLAGNVLNTNVRPLRLCGQ